MTFAIKVRKTGQRQFYFLTPGGGQTRLQVHAMRFRESVSAQSYLDTNAPANPEYEWKVVEL
jgi:hypothetical protein